MSEQKETFIRYTGGIALFVLGGLIGLSMPDIDRSFYWLRHFGVLNHRSILTHSFLLPWLLYTAVYARTTRPGRAADNALPLRLFVMGMALSCALHLSFDLFPRAWQGYARIHVPLVGWMPPLACKAWLFSSIVVCVHLAARLLHNTGEILLALLGIALWFGLAAAREPMAAWLVPLVFLPAAFIGFVLPRPSRTFGA